jgi:hypothetical protein
MHALMSTVLSCQQQAGECSAFFSKSGLNKLVHNAQIKLHNKLQLSLLWSTHNNSAAVHAGVGCLCMFSASKHSALSQLPYTSNMHSTSMRCLSKQENIKSWQHASQCAVHYQPVMHHIHCGGAHNKHATKCRNNTVRRLMHPPRHAASACLPKAG